MPEYTKSDITFEITRERLLLMTGATSRPKEKFLACVLWMTGARPSEIQELEKSDVFINETKIVFKVVTKKKKKGSWHQEKRELEFDRPLPPQSDKVLEFVVWYIDRQPDGRLLGVITVRTMENMIERMGKRGLGNQLPDGKGVCPYNFRHSRMTILSRQGRTIDEMMHFKGASDIRSVTPYLHAKPFKVAL